MMMLADSDALHSSNQKNLDVVGRDVVTVGRRNIQDTNNNLQNT